jgi:N-glycosylase/DNA lyase
LSSISKEEQIDPLISINSGQTFLWERHDKNWYGINGNLVIRVSNFDDNPAISYYSDNEAAETDYFRTRDNRSEMLADISKHEYMKKLVQTYPGLAILRQDPFQCLISFICATNSGIPMIRRVLMRLCRKFGAKVTVDGLDFYTFPEPRKLGTSTLAEIRTCGVGFRAAALEEASVSVVNGWIELDYLRRMSYDQAKEKLMSLKGVGNKVADCVLLFSLDKLESFPIDVWINRALSSNYPEIMKGKMDKLSPKQYEIISKRARDHFGKYAGYAQQFLYYHIRSQASRPW